MLTFFFFLMIRRPPRSTLTHSFPTRRSSDLCGRLHTGTWFSTWAAACVMCGVRACIPLRPRRSEEHTSELQSLMRISYAVFCLKKKTITNSRIYLHNTTKHQYLIKNHKLTHPNITVIIMKTTTHKQNT